MAEILSRLFMLFANQTGLIVQLWHWENLGFWALLAIGALACLLGVRVYRAYSSAMFFMATATVTCLLLRDHAGWRSIVTLFTVVGITLAFMALFWNKLDAGLLSLLLGAAVGWSLFHSVWGVIPFALAGAVLTGMFPLDGIRAVMAVFGTWLLYDLSKWAGLSIHWLFTIPAAAAGYFTQRLVSRRQTLFKKVRPNRVTHWLEERERKRQAKALQRQA